MVRHGNGKWRTTTHEEKKRTGTWKQETNSSPTTTRCHGSRRTTKRQRITRLFPSPPVTLIPSIYLSMPMFEGRSFSFLSQFFRHTLGWEWVVSLSPFPFENVSCMLFSLLSFDLLLLDHDYQRKEVCWEFANYWSTKYWPEIVLVLVFLQHFKSSMFFSTVSSTQV